MLVMTIVDGLGIFEISVNTLRIAGVAAWIAASLLFVDTPKILRIQVVIIVAVGLVLNFYGAVLGADIDFTAIISGNTHLVTMIAAVGFLKLVAFPVSSRTFKLPTGAKAYLQTLLGISITGAVINISAPIIIADRIHEVRPLTRFTSQSFTRIFCGVANWSPFFGGMAIILNFLDDADLYIVILAGFPVTIIGFFLVLIESRIRYSKEVESFVGYPIKWSYLGVPLYLAFCVILFTWVLPSISILINIALSALIVTLGLLIVRTSIRTVVGLLGNYIVDGLPRIVNELTLFLAAGLIAAAMSSLIDQGVISNPFVTFDAEVAVKILSIMLLLAAMGVHPVILISSFTPMILTLNPDPNLLAVTYLIAWNLGTCASPLSGTHLVFQGRYDIPSWKAAIWNWPYVLLMSGLAMAWLQFLDTLL